MASLNGPIISGGKTLFTREELRSPDTEIIRMDSEFVQKLALTRIALGLPMYITSACRSKSYNDEIKGHPRSSHVYDEPYRPYDGCAAIDSSIANYTIRDMSRLIHIAALHRLSVGLNLKKKFVHLDARCLVGLNTRLFFYDDEPPLWAQKPIIQLASEN